MRSSRRERMQYRFDNMMSRGMSSKLKLLLTVTLIYIFVVGLISSFCTSNADEGPLQSLWKTLLYVVGKGVPSLEGGSTLYVLLALLSVFYCMFFTAILIGLINQGIRSKVDELDKGQSKVLEEGHTLVLGFNEITLALLGELIEANRNKPHPETVVILDDIDRSEMQGAIQRRLGPAWKHPQTRLICRTGLCYQFDDLRRCALETSRVVIVNAENDFDAIKMIMACSHILNQSDEEYDPYLVAAIKGEESIIESRIAARSSKMTDRLELLSLNSVLARIMVHTSRQPGLSDVFTELLNYADNEFYILADDLAFSRLWGKSVAEINHYLIDAYAVGVVHNGEVVIAMPHEVFFAEGDALIVVAENDDALKVLPGSYGIDCLDAELVPDEAAACVLIFGVQPVLDDILSEYANYLPGGSQIFVVEDSRGFDLDGVLSDATRDLLTASGIDLQVRMGDLHRGDELDGLLEEVQPSSALVVTDHHSDDPNAEDEYVFRILLHLREFRSQSDCQFSITSEMNLPVNKELAVLTEPDDFIVSRELAALLMAQISQERQMAQLFDALLSDEGFEVYLKSVRRYVPTGVPVDLFSVGEAVADKGEVFIGLRRKGAQGHYRAAEINPSKFASDSQAPRHYTFGEDDFLVVLAGS